MNSLQRMTSLWVLAVAAAMPSAACASDEDPSPSLGLVSATAEEGPAARPAALTPRLTIEGLRRARGRVEAMRAKAAEVLKKISGGSGPGAQCERIVDQSQCRQRPDCYWRGPADDGRCLPRSGESDLSGTFEENDLLAGRAMLAIQSQVNQQGELMDRSIDALQAGDPMAFVMGVQLCGMAVVIVNQSMQGKRLAILLPIGLVTTDDFEFFITESQGVRLDLGC